jgi:outer membrane lipoprotein-sorting protein
MRRAAEAILLCAISTLTPSFAAGWDVEALMTLLHANPPARAHFVETKEISTLLDRPLESSGEITFTPPDRLEKHVTRPGDERVIADRERVVIERNGQRRELALADYPQVAVLVESIRATLAGDRAALERTYALELSGAATDWRLTLRPREPAAAKLVTRVTIEGSQAQVRRVTVEQADGDRSLMRIVP